jgi:glutathione peroxidase
MKRVRWALISLFALSLTPTGAGAQQQAPSPAAVTSALIEQQGRFAGAPAPSAADQNSAYQFEFPGLMTDRVPLNAFRGEVMLVVNTASRCGFTPQYAGLQQIYNEYHGRGFEVVGVPSNNFGGQEPGTAQQIEEFCRLNYGVTFPMAAKTDVTGAQAHPFYQWARAQLGPGAVPQWNFHKLLVDRNGRIIAAFGSNVTPTSSQLRTAIEQALGS